jgi:hypothetical protein
VFATFTVKVAGGSDALVLTNVNPSSHRSVANLGSISVSSSFAGNV